MPRAIRRGVREAPILPAWPIDRADPLWRGLVERWRCEPNYNDRGTAIRGLCGTLDAAIVGGAAYAGTTRSGGRGQLDFSGSGQYADLGNPAALNFGAGDYTFSLWIRPANLSGPYQLFSKDNVPGRQWAVDLNVTYESFVPGSFGLAYFPSSNFVGVGTTSTPVVAGKWQQLTISRSGSAIDLYWNGLPQPSRYYVGSSSHPQTMVGTATNLRIAARQIAGAEGYFPGSIDDVCVWNRPLTAAEALSLYRRTGGLAPIGSGVNRLGRRSSPLLTAGSTPTSTFKPAWILPSPALGTGVF